MTDILDADSDDVPDKPAQVEHRLYQAAIGLTVTQTVDSPAGTVTTVRELPPDTKAALAYLSRYDTSWRDDRPATAVQFVMMLPDMAPSTTAWLEQVRARQQGTILDGQVDPGRLEPVVSGPVPDPVDVPTAHARAAISKNDPVPLDGPRPLLQVLGKNRKKSKFKASA